MCITYVEIQDTLADQMFMIHSWLLAECTHQQCIRCKFSYTTSKHCNKGFN